MWHAGSLDKTVIHLASQALQRFLSATVAPPAPDIRPDDWVRLGRVGASGQNDDDTLCVHLYEIRPDSLSRIERRSGSDGVDVRPPLLLSLHYVITYHSDSPRTSEIALGGVLRAFHSHPRLKPLDYLLSGERAEAAKFLPDKLEVRLEIPETDRLATLLGGSGTNAGLALYYAVCSLAVPAKFEPRSPFVDRACAQEPALFSKGAGS